MKNSSDQKRPFFPFFQKTLKTASFLLLIGAPLYSAQTHEKVITERDLLKNSMVAYHADGGFTGVKSYSVLISCVDGQISTLSSIQDPRLHGLNTPLRVKGSMSHPEYLQLWANLNKLAVLKKKDAPAPKMDILDEFTIRFEANVGKQANQFKVEGCTRHEAAQYFAIRSLLDKAVGMTTLWDTHGKLAKN